MRLWLRNDDRIDPSCDTIPVINLSRGRSRANGATGGCGRHWRPHRHGRQRPKFDDVFHQHATASPSRPYPEWQCAECPPSIMRYPCRPCSGEKPQNPQDLCSAFRHQWSR